MKNNKPLSLAQQIRNMDDRDLSDFLEEIINHCADLGRFGTDACDECPLQSVCDADSFYTALTTPMSERS